MVCNKFNHIPSGFKVFEWSFNINIKKTGKKSADEISEKIVGLRKKCFISLDENDDIKCQVLGFFDFLLNDKALEEEIVSVFGSFSIENLYIEIF